MQETDSNKLPHRLLLEDRAYMQISGVTDVQSFDEETVKLCTTAGEMTISGSGLHISQLQLETGDVHIHGKMNSILYAERTPHRPLLKRLFR